MSSIRREILALVLIGGLVLAGPFTRTSLASENGVSGRLFTNFGPWISHFSQSDASRELKLTSMMSAAAQLQAGIGISLFFVEYNLSWLISAYSANPKARDACYFSPLGANVGVALPILPIELYIGGEKGTYKLNGGINPSYSGLAARAGVNIPFPISGMPHARVGFKAEFRRFFASSDDAGSFPDGFRTRADTFFVGLTFGRK